MGEHTEIAWTDHTFNPWWGCEQVSPGCKHCYAEAFAKRTGHQVWGSGSPRRFFSDAHWAEPLKWNARALALGTRHRARTMDPSWARRVVERCQDASVAVFVKQIATSTGRLMGDRKGTDPRWWPVGDWPRQFPS